MELSLIISILTLVIVVVVAYLVFSNKSKDAATLDPEKFETNTKELMDKIIAETKDVAKIESKPKFEGRQMVMIIQPL